MKACESQNRGYQAVGTHPVNDLVWLFSAEKHGFGHNDHADPNQNERTNNFFSLLTSFG